MRLLIDEPRFDSITKYRGSFYHAEDFPHLKEKLAGKIIGLSYNPAFTLAYGQPIHFYTMIADFTKALRIIEDHFVTLFVCPPLLQLKIEVPFVAWDLDQLRI